MSHIETLDDALHALRDGVDRDRRRAVEVLHRLTKEARNFRALMAIADVALCQWDRPEIRLLAAKALLESEHERERLIASHDPTRHPPLSELFDGFNREGLRRRIVSVFAVETDPRIARLEVELIYSLGWFEDFSLLGSPSDDLDSDQLVIEKVLALCPSEHNKAPMTLRERITNILSDVPNLSSLETENRRKALMTLRDKINVKRSEFDKQRAAFEKESDASGLPRTGPFDLMFLYDRHFIDVSAIGQSIVLIRAKVTSLMGMNVRVLVAPGTSFRSSGRHQNMVTRQKYTFALKGLASHHFDIAASCLNATLPVPGADDHFGGVARASRDVTRFLDASQDASPMVVQTGVWALTDGYTRDQVQSRLVERLSGNVTRRSAVSNEDIAEAKRILDTLGIRNSL